MFRDRWLIPCIACSGTLDVSGLWDLIWFLLTDIHTTAADITTLCCQNKIGQSVIFCYCFYTVDELKHSFQVYMFGTMMDVIVTMLLYTQLYAQVVLCPGKTF